MARTGSGLNENYLHRPTCLKTWLPAGGAVNRGYGTFRMWSLDEASMSKGHALGVYNFDPLPVCSVLCVIIFYQPVCYAECLLPCLLHYYGLPSGTIGRNIQILSEKIL